MKRIAFILFFVPLVLFGQIPTTNVTIDTVGNTIGNISRNVGVLCTATTINKWSRKKPVIQEGSTNWWESIARDFSLTITNMPLADLVYTSNSLYTYKRPTGTYPSSGYRLGDFRGYLHTSVPFVYTESFPSGSISDIATPSVFSYRKNNDTNLGIVPNDFENSYGLLGNYYYGVLVEWVADGYTNRAVITDSYNLSNASRNDLPIDLDSSPFNSANGTYRWLSFISSRAITTWTMWGDLTVDDLIADIIVTPGIDNEITKYNKSTFAVYSYSIATDSETYDYAAAASTNDIGVTTSPTAGEWSVISLTYDDVPSQDMFSVEPYKYSSDVLRFSLNLNETFGVLGCHVLLRHTVDTSKEKTIYITQQN